LTELNAGRRIVEYVLRDGDLKPFLDAGFTREWLYDKKDTSRYAVFTSNDDFGAYEHILIHYDKHGVVPTREMFEKSYPPESYKLRAGSDYEASELIAAAHDHIKTVLVTRMVSEIMALNDQGEYDAALLKVRETDSLLSFPLTDFNLELGIRNEMHHLRIRREAQQRIDAANDDWSPPEFLTGPELAETQDNYTWRVDDLITVGSNVLVNASYKAGKSTLIINLIRSMLTEEDFLGKFGTKPAASIKLIDMEMPRATGKTWMEEAGLLKYKELSCSFLVGRPGSLSVLDETKRKRIADDLRGTDVLIIDPLGPLMAAHGMDENSNTDIRRLLNGLTALKTEAGISELIVVHHAGHQASRRSRGASVLGDWPDVIVNLRNKDPDNPSGVRSISAFGRDVMIPETDLFHDRATRSLRTLDSTARTTTDDLKDKILNALRGNGGPMSGSKLATTVGGRKENVLKAVRELHAKGFLEQTAGGYWFPKLATGTDGNRFPIQPL
jgi:biotin operon repressor